MSGNTALRQQRIDEQARALWEAAGSPPPGPEAFRDDASQRIAQEEKAVDTANAQSFPASDPPAHSGITGPSNG